MPSDLILRLLPEGAILQVQIGPVPLKQDYVRPFSRPDSGRSSRPASGPDSGRPPRPNWSASRHPNLGRDRPISPFTDWSSFEEMPTRLDLEEEEEVIACDSESDSHYVPPKPVYEPGSPGPEPTEKTPKDPRPGPSTEEGLDFTDYARTRVRGRGRGIPGIPVQCVAHFFRGNGNRRNFLGRVRPM